MVIWIVVVVKLLLLLCPIVVKLPLLAVKLLLLLYQNLCENICKWAILDNVCITITTITAITTTALKGQDNKKYLK